MKSIVNHYIYQYSTEQAKFYYGCNYKAEFNSKSCTCTSTAGRVNGKLFQLAFGFSQIQNHRNDGKLNYYMPCRLIYIMNKNLGTLKLKRNGSAVGDLDRQYKSSLKLHFDVMLWSLIISSPRQTFPTRLYWPCLS